MSIANKENNIPLLRLVWASFTLLRSTWPNGLVCKKLASTCVRIWARPKSVQVDTSGWPNETQVERKSKTCIDLLRLRAGPFGQAGLIGASRSQNEWRRSTPLKDLFSDGGRPRVPELPSPPGLGEGQNSYTNRFWQGDLCLHDDQGRPGGRATWFARPGNPIPRVILLPELPHHPSDPTTRDEQKCSI